MKDKVKAFFVFVGLLDIPNSKTIKAIKESKLDRQIKRIEKGDE